MKQPFFDSLPNKTITYKNIDCNSNKLCKERLSLLFCANMDGSEKLKPIVIDRTINKMNLPCYYRYNQKMWMIESIYNEWLLKINNYYKGENRQILLFVGNLSGHSPKKGQPAYELSNVKFIIIHQTSLLFCSQWIKVL